MSLMRGLRGSLGHVVGYHVESCAKGGANVARFNVMAQHMHAHVDMSGGWLVCWMESHGDGPLVVHVNVCGTGISKTCLLYTSPSPRDS